MLLECGCPTRERSAGMPREKGWGARLSTRERFSPILNRNV